MVISGLEEVTVVEGMIIHMRDGVIRERDAKLAPTTSNISEN